MCFYNTRSCALNNTKSSLKTLKRKEEKEMNLTEILKAKGLDDKTIEETIGEMKQNKIFCHRWLYWGRRRNGFGKR